MEIVKYCKYCGKEYIARRIRSMCCSKECNRKLYKQEMQKKKIKAKLEASDVENCASEVKSCPKEFLTPTEAAKLLGIGRATLYRYMMKGTIKALQLSRKTIIRRSDLEVLFDAAPAYKKHSSFSRKSDTKEYYTVREIKEKFHICKKAILARCDRLGIPKVYEGRNVFFNKNSVDLGFTELIEEIDLANYYTTEQIMAKYNMSRGNVIAYVSRNKIPRITRGRNVYYSKVHMDMYKRKGEDIDINWYSYGEITEKYGISVDQISYYIRHCGLKTEKRGKFTMIFRSDFDQKVVKEKFANIQRDKETGKFIFTVKPQHTEKKDSAQPSSPEGYYSAEEISKKYKLLIKRVHVLAKEYNFPKISLKGFNYYQIEAVDEVFNQPTLYTGVKEWITPEVIETEYGMTPVARRNFLSRHKIPSKLEFGKIFYSKTHIDNVKNNYFAGREDYYSVHEAMKKYSLTKDLVFYYLKQYKIPKKKMGQFVYILKKDLDELMKIRFAKEKGDLMKLEKLENSK